MDASLNLEQVISFLLDTPIFSDLPADGLSDVVKSMRIQTVRAGHDVFGQGDVGDAWYVVYQGQVVVTREGRLGAHRTITVLGPHACFGEMAVLDGSLRSATVTAEETTTLLRFPRTAFQEMLGEGNLAAYQLVLGMARVLCERQRRLTGEVHGLLDDTSDDPTSLRSRMQKLVDTYQASE